VVEQAVQADQDAPLANARQLVGRHRLAGEAPLVLECVVQVLALQPREPPAAERVIGARPAPAGDLEIDQVREAVVADQDVLGLFEST